MKKVLLIALLAIASITSYAQTKFSLRADGTILKDNQPFFPMGFYIERGTIDSYKAKIESLSEASTFNIVNLPFISGDNAAWKSLLDLCISKNIYVISQLQNNSKYPQQLEEVATVFEQIDLFKNHPAICAWSIDDEADDIRYLASDVELQDILKYRNDQCKARDINHFTEISLTGYYSGRRQTVDNYTPITDISAYKIYPITPYSDYDVTSSNALTQTYLRTLLYVQSCAKVKKPLIMNSQNFKWEKSPSPRYPTVSELRNMTYSGLASGIKGIISYVYGPGILSQASLWNENIALRNDVTVLEHALLNGTLTRVDTGDPAFEVSYWTTNDAIYIVVVNTSYTISKNLSIPAPANFGDTLTPLFARMPNTLSLSNDTLSGIIAPKEVEVYLLENLNPDNDSPSAPTGLESLSVSFYNYTLSWNASTDNNGINFYEVFKDSLSLGTTADTSMNITGVDCSTVYCMTVQAIDFAGNRSILSSTLPVNTLACDLQAPSIPAGLSGSDITSTSFILTWAASTDDNSGVKFYEVFKDGILLDTTTSTSINITGITQGSTNTMTVKAVDAMGNKSEMSIALVVNTESCDDSEAPSIPTLSSSGSHDYCNLSWTTSTDNVGVTGYEVFKNGVFAGTTSKNYMIFKGLNCETNYTFTVRAYDACYNQSEKSDASTIILATCYYEVEEALINGGSIWRNHAGYSGLGFWAEVVNEGLSAIFYVNSLTGGSTTVKCRYSAGNWNQNMSLYVNGNKIKQLTFLKTSNWDTWANKIDTITLNAGSNTIKYQYDAGDNGTINIDYISITKVVPTLVPSLNADELLVYPNPANSVLTISNVRPKSKITVYGIDGKIITELKSDNNTVYFDVAHWAKGLYLFYIQSENQVIVKKAILK